MNRHDKSPHTEMISRLEEEDNLFFMVMADRHQSSPSPAYTKSAEMPRQTADMVKCMQEGALFPATSKLNCPSPHR